MHPQKQIAEMVVSALQSAIASDSLPEIGEVAPSVERPKHAEHGDYSTSVAMALASSMRMAPRAIATEIVDNIPSTAMVDDVSIAGPGFINFKLDDEWLRSQIHVIREAGVEFAHLDVGAGQSVQVEFVSVNPTGPLHIGHVRGAAIGNGLANILGAAGYDVQREYYVNDAGNQMRIFAESAYVRFLQAAGKDAELGAESYPGEYVVELGAELYSELGDPVAGLDADEAMEAISAPALDRTLANIRGTLDRMGIEYDEWFSEKSLIDGDDFDDSLKLLEERGYVSEREGALWFLGTKIGLESDSVIIRSKERGPSYFGTDIAYHYNKFVKRGFDRVINVWGADHHGHVARMKAVVDSLGVAPEKLTIIINQIVNFKKGDETVRFNKRKDNFIAADELLDAVGPDACHYIFLERTPGTHMEFDLELAKAETSENPVFYVQYAHARLCAVLRAASERGIEFEDGDVSLLTTHQELALMRRLNELPDVIARSAEMLEPHHMPHFAYEVARELQRFYEACRVISSDPADAEITKARLLLVDAARIVLAGTLNIMGMNAPERM
ncbi:MAG: arginine--tRNA ligase [Chloroflexi bacterium]|nr:arginine--tRNA ligase [Chloroflexota bacterium]MYF79732.1 arginine--tRNA ligase [Chloroflexota bacterium]